MSDIFKEINSMKGHVENNCQKWKVSEIPLPVF